MATDTGRGAPKGAVKKRNNGLVAPMMRRQRSVLIQFIALSGHSTRPSTQDRFGFGKSSRMSRNSFDPFINALLGTVALLVASTCRRFVERRVAAFF
jgi:hypothetical protein